MVIDSGLQKHGSNPGCRTLGSALLVDKCTFLQRVYSKHMHKPPHDDPRSSKPEQGAVPPSSRWGTKGLEVGGPGLAYRRQAAIPEAGLRMPSPENLQPHDSEEQVNHFQQLFLIFQIFSALKTRAPENLQPAEGRASGLDPSPWPTPWSPPGAPVLPYKVPVSFLPAWVWGSQMNSEVPSN